MNSNVLGPLEAWKHNFITRNVILSRYEERNLRTNRKDKGNKNK